MDGTVKPQSPGERVDYHSLEAGRPHQSARAEGECRRKVRAGPKRVADGTHPPVELRRGEIRLEQPCLSARMGEAEGARTPLRISHANEAEFSPFADGGYGLR